MLEHYREASHRAHLESWLETRGLSREMCEMLPRMGFVSSVNGQLCAAAFLRICERHVAMIEGLVTNPCASSERRNACIDEVVLKLIEKARNRGIRTILSYSVDESTLMRSVKHGFLKLPHTLIGLELGVIENGLHKQTTGNS